MVLDASARKSNCKDSVKKFFVDNIYTTEGKEVVFDKSLSTPDLKDKTVDRWVVVNFGPMDMTSLAELYLNIFICTRKDSEGFKNAQLRDTVMGYLTDNTQTDGMARIPLYQSRSSGSWTLLAGGFVVQEITEGEEFDIDDQTKGLQLTVRLRWGCKI